MAVAVEVKRAPKVQPSVEREARVAERKRFAAHICEGGCGRLIRWELSLCTCCSWRGYPLDNFPWPPSHRPSRAGK